MGMNQQFLQNEDITSEDLMGKKTLWDPQSMYIYIYIHTHRHGLSGSCAPKKQKSIHLRQFQHNQGISLHKTVLSPPFDPCNGPVLPPRQFNSGHGLEAIPFPLSTWQSVSSSACVRGHAMPAVFFKEPERKKRT